MSTDNTKCTVAITHARIENDTFFNKNKGKGQTNWAYAVIKTESFLRSKLLVLYKCKTKSGTNVSNLGDQSHTRGAMKLKGILMSWQRVMAVYSINTLTLLREKLICAKVVKLKVMQLMSIIAL